jgi:ribosomal protein S15P/S13E
LSEKKSWIPDIRFRSREKRAREKARKGQDSQSIDDLLLQGRFTRARQVLEAHIAVNDEDVHSRIKLAEILASRRQTTDALQHYLKAAQLLADDGFFDKALALLKTSRKLAPKDTQIDLMEEQILRSRELDRAAWSVRKDGGDSRSKLAASIELEAMWRRMGDSDFVQSLGQGELEALMAVMELRPVDAGSYVVHEGDDRRELYLIGTGLVQARLDPLGRDLLLRNFGPGQILGERALFENESWKASLRAAHNSQILALDINGVQRALKKTKSRRRLVDSLSSQHNDQQLAALATSVSDSDKY